MKRILLILTLALSANAFATPAEECSKFTAFKGNQDRKLLLSRYGLGLIKRDQYEALNKASFAQEKAAIAQCGVLK